MCTEGDSDGVPSMTSHCYAVAVNEQTARQGVQQSCTTFVITPQ